MCHWLEISNTILSGWCSGLSGFEVSTRFTSPCIWHQWNPLPDPGYPVPTTEPLSPKDMSNLKRLVWMITTVWSLITRGIRAYGSLSVQQLDALLPSLSALKICQRWVKSIGELWKSFLPFILRKRRYQKVVRKRGVIKPLLNEIRFKLLELQQKENDGLLMLDKLSKHGINGLIRRQ